jgi:hypothetical protein
MDPLKLCSYLKRRVCRLIFVASAGDCTLATLAPVKLSVKVFRHLIVIESCRTWLIDWPTCSEIIRIGGRSSKYTSKWLVKNQLCVILHKFYSTVRRQWLVRFRNAPCFTGKLPKPSAWRRRLSSVACSLHARHQVPLVNCFRVVETSPWQFVVFLRNSTCTVCVQAIQILICMFIMNLWITAVVEWAHH